MPPTPALQPAVRDFFPVLKELNESLPSAQSINLMQGGGSQSGHGDAQALVRVQNKPTRSLMEQNNRQSNQLAAPSAVALGPSAGSAPSVQGNGSTQTLGSAPQARDKIRLSEEGRALTLRTEHPRFPKPFPQRLTVAQYQQLSRKCVCRGVGCLNEDRGRSWIQSTGIRDVPSHFWLTPEQKHVLDLKLGNWIRSGVPKDSIMVRRAGGDGRPSIPYLYTLLLKRVPKETSSAAVSGATGGDSVSAAHGVQEEERSGHHMIPLGPRTPIPSERAKPTTLASETPRNVTHLLNSMVDEEAAKAKAALVDTGARREHGPLHPASGERGDLEEERRRLDAKLRNAKQSLGVLLQDIHSFHAHLRGGHDGGLEEGEIPQQALVRTAPSLTSGDDAVGPSMGACTPNRPRITRPVNAEIKDIATSSPCDLKVSQYVSPIRQNRKRANSDAFHDGTTSAGPRDAKMRYKGKDQITWKYSTRKNTIGSEGSSGRPAMVDRLPNGDSYHIVRSSDSYNSTTSRGSLVDNLRRKITHVQNQVDKLDSMRKDFKQVETELRGRLSNELARTRQKARSSTDNMNLQREFTFYQRLNNFQRAREARLAMVDGIGRLTPPRDMQRSAKDETDNTQRPDHSLGDRSRAAWTQF